MKKLLFLFLLLAGDRGSFAQAVNTNISNESFFGGEPYIAINPNNNQNLVVAWMSIQFSSGSFRVAIKTRASFDGGRTWGAPGLLPHFGTAYGSADVSMAFGKNGTLYLAYIDYRQSPDSGGIYVSRSTNGGSSWDTPSKAFDMYDDPNKRPIDRPWLVVDNSSTSNAGTLYITTKPAPWIPAPNRNYFKVSSDGGFTWTAIANVDGGTHLVGNYIAAPMAAPSTTVNGNFLAAYPSYVPSQHLLPTFYLAKSIDKGQNFSYTTMIADTVQKLDSNLKGGYRLIASPADSNRMAFITPQAKNGDADVFALHSNDGGISWSSRTRVNDDATGNGKDQDLVWADYNEQGKLIVTWRDRRNAATNGFWNADYDFYYATSTDNGQSFSPNQLLTGQLIPFDSLTAENGNDFMSCVYTGDTLCTAWGDTRNGKMNIYFSKTVVSTNTGIGFSQLDGEESLFSVFPNPVINQLNVQVDQKLIGKQLAVYDTEGKRVYTQTLSNRNVQLKTSQWTSGFYVLKIGDEMLRVIKE